MGPIINEMVDSENKPTLAESGQDTNNFELENFSVISSNKNDTHEQETTNTTEPREYYNQKWVLYKDENIVKKFFKRVWYGPIEPKDDFPVFQRKWNFTKYIDEFPEKVFRKKLGRKFTISLLIIYLSVWLCVVWQILYPYLIKKPYLYLSPDNINDEAEKVSIDTLTCNSYMDWKGKNNNCGLNAKNCQPFTDTDYFIRCPALCDRGGWTYSSLPVGDQSVKYRPYIIGGGNRAKDDDLLDDILSYPYRADSYPCAAAYHSGLISGVHGGCLKISMSGAQLKFPSKDAYYDSESSILFDSFFISSYVFRDLKDAITSGCYDPRVLIMTLNIIFGLPIFYLYESLIGFWVITMFGFWTLVLSFDRPLVPDPNDIDSVHELFSLGFQRLLPLCFVLYVMWKSSIKRTIENGSPLIKIFCWYPLFWLGVMNNVTFDRLPVDRLTASDIKAQPGALVAIISIGSSIFICAVIQAYSLWKSGRFPKYFKIYITIIASLVAMSLLPGLNLRIHHYILGMILLPGCATRNVSAYLFQGILVGLILSGVGRWDFASILETRRALLRGEAGDAMKPPTFIYNETMSHVLSWNSSKPNVYGHGYSLIINDVESYVGTNTTVDLDVLMEENESLSQLIEGALSYEDTVKLYLRVAHASVFDPIKKRGDYTKAAMLEWPSGKWIYPDEGVS
ncbi:uncharacterized protein SCODWIG_01576 [Saccharomycodes ludwigii]|uniref:LCCL domain-containing protein n=1 Tax=Saccharomycodes ludwigii TaxID=36035 RepID=A0A376B547_9ASCO|nr:hypothetical protein SCDLUD_000331 [Saccharomycodes ludwigii]KAH3902743.1 hypothetical protein SCDLUD_000331 [Saccharomycodes ludwigii]SSD59815.1 uncharacterized protein SCODWIG_01576 [Saccharomycodes ludwigii]